MNATENRDVLQRVKEALRAESLFDVATLLGESVGAVKSWSARGSVPLHALIRTSEVAGCSLSRRSVQGLRCTASQNVRQCSVTDRLT